MNRSPTVCVIAWLIALSVRSSVSAANEGWRADADSVLTKAEALYENGRYVEARGLFQSHSDLVRERSGGVDPDMIESMIWVSATYWKMGQHATGEEIARDATDLAKRLLGEDDPQVGQALNMLGLCLMAQAKFPEADKAYRASLEILEAHYGHQSEEVAMCLNNLGALAGEQARWERAEIFYRAAYAINLELLGDDDLRVARNMHNIGYAAGARGDVLTSRRYLNKALEIRRRHLGDDHPDVILTLQTLAGSYRLDDPRTGYETLEQVVAVRRRVLGDQHPHVAWALRDLADASIARGDYAAADAQLEEAIAIYEHADEPMEYARTLFSMAKVKVIQGQFVEAEEYLAAELDRSTYRAFQILAGIRYVQGRYDEAEEFLVRAATEYERTRTALTGPQSRIRRPLATPYPMLAATCLRNGKPELAWPALERSLGRGLIDQLAVENEDESARVPTLIEIQDALLPGDALIGWLDYSLFGRSPAAWVYVIRDRGPVHWAMLDGAEPTNIGVAPGGRTTVSDRPRRFRESLSYAAAWVTRVTDTRQIDKDAHGLWRERVAPVEQYLEGVGHIVVVGSNEMVDVPIEALIDANGRTIGERFVVSYTPSATVHRWTYEQRRNQEITVRRALLVGDPLFLPYHERPAELASADIHNATVLRSALSGNREALSTLPALPASRDEVNHIATSIAEPTILLGPDASEEKIIEIVHSGKLVEFDAVHFATHALIDDLFPDISALILSQVDLPDPVAVDTPDDPADGLLTVDEIFANWRLHAEVVSLSGCQTALGRRTPGEGYLGFSQAFFHAGARSVILSLWEVDDAAAAMLMTRFYENLTGSYDDVRRGVRAEAMPKAAALQEAKLWLRGYERDGVRPFAHPAYWASFILIGDASDHAVASSD